MIESAVYWGWIINGLGGAVNILRRAVEAGQRPPEHHLVTLRETRDDLARIIEELEGLPE